jgi:hypothetical protein
VAGISGIGPASGTAAARRAEERRSALLASLPLAFRRRLALGVFRAIGREPVADLSTSHPGFEPIFSSLLAGAARSAAQSAASSAARSAASSGRAVAPGAVPEAGGAQPGGVVVRWRAAPGGAGVERRGRALFVTVSPSWVADVWAWGAAAVDGWVVLEVVRRPSLDRLVVRGLSPGADEDGGGVRPSLRPALRYASIRRVGDGWRLEDGAGSSCARSRRASATAFPSQSLLK